MRAFVFVVAVLAACGGKTAAPSTPGSPAAPVAAAPAAADGTVTTADGTALELASVWQAHSTVLVFYRGFY